MLHQLAQRVYDFFKRGEAFVFGQLVDAQLAEIIGLAFGPMQLIQIQIIGVEPFKAGFAGFKDLRAGKVVAVADIGVQPIAVVARRSGDFAGEHKIIAFAARRNPRANDLLGAGVGFFARRHGIHLGGVNKVHAVGKGIIQLGIGFIGGVLLAPSHRAKADFAHLNAACA